MGGRSSEKSSFLTFSCALHRERSFIRTSPDAARVPTKVWTIGYETHTPESLVATLAKARIERVVDVRERAQSRKPGFSKTALSNGLARHGIAYTHVRALGTPPDVRHAYKAGGGFGPFKKGYLAHLAKHDEDVDALAALAKKERVALLCLEHDAEACHRTLLARVLEERGFASVAL